MVSRAKAGGDSGERLLILLVGANPLPNFLSACALRPRRLALVHSQETADAKDRLKTACQRVLGDDVTFVDPDPFVEDATCVTTVRRAVEPLVAARDEAWLNYTGGTKVMAVHARIAYGDGRPQDASYLDEGGNEGQPGTSKALSEYPGVPLDLTTILALHGITHKPRTPVEPGPKYRDSRDILARVLQDHSLAEELYRERRRLQALKTPARACAEPFEPRKYGLELSVSQIPDGSGMNRKAFKRWAELIGGGWLEEWLGEQIRHLELTPEPEVTVGVNAYRGSKKAQFEIDVAVVRGHRSYFISCTTDSAKGLCKSKLFEVAVRARQLGGDLTRAALVCLADDKTAGALQSDIDDVWGASNTTRVFGLPDLDAWSDAGGKQPNRLSLAEWLES